MSQGLNTLWITGGNGFLGGEVVQLAREKRLAGRVVTIARRPPPDGAEALSFDLTDAVAVEQAFIREPPSAVIHLAAAADPNWCEQHPDEASAINVAAGTRLAGLCQAAGIRLVFASTDLVFDGTAAPYGEEAPPGPVNAYGRQKWLAEQAMREILGTHLVVCRLPLMFGTPTAAGRDPQGAIRRALTGGPAATLFVDEFRSLASTRAVAEGLLLALSLDRPLLHLGGRERLSRLDYGRRLAVWLGLAAAGLLPGRQADVQMPAARPPDVTLDNRLACSLGFNPLPLEEEWSRMAFFREWRATGG